MTNSVINELLLLLFMRTWLINQSALTSEVALVTSAVTWALPAMSGFRAPVIGFPLPIGALTKSRKSASGWHAYRLAALQVSITEPPPTATNTSNEFFLANAMASLKLQHTQKVTLMHIYQFEGRKATFRLTVRTTCCHQNADMNQKHWPRNQVWI